MFTEVSLIDSINVKEDDIIEVRVVNKILKDEVEVSRTYHRHTLIKGADLADQDAKVVAIAMAAWGL